MQEGKAEKEEGEEEEDKGEEEEGEEKQVQLQQQRNGRNLGRIHRKIAQSNDNKCNRDNGPKAMPVILSDAAIKRRIKVSMTVQHDSTFNN